MSVWTEAGFGPDSFWDQTAATFEAAIGGVRRRAEREAADRIVQAHATALFMRVKKLSGDVRKYLPAKDGGKQSPDDMLAMLRALQAGGAPMTIRKRGNGS